MMQLHNGVFLKVTRPIINMLRYVAPYVTFGYPTLSSVRELVYKRGHVRVVHGTRGGLADELNALCIPCVELDDFSCGVYRGTFRLSFFAKVVLLVQCTNKLAVLTS